MAVQFQIRRDTSVNWGLTNPTLAQGEMGYETNTYKMKIGNGTSDWNTLVYFPTTALTLDAITDPAIDAAVTTLKIDAYSGTVITLTTTGNSQTLQAPTSIVSGKSFIVINNDTSTNNITVNTIVITPGSAINFIWDGTVWIGIGGGTLDHSVLTNLSYATSGHTGFQSALTFGIADTNAVQITMSGVVDNDYAKFSPSGLVGRSYSEVLSDIGAQASLGFTPEDVANKRTTFQVIPDDTHYISEKLAYDQLALKANDNSVVHTTGNETVDGIKTFSSIPLSSGVPSTDYQVANKKYVDDSVGAENLWNRVSTTLYPHTLNDNINIGSGVAYIGGGFTDANVSTAVKLGSSTDTSLTTTKKDILGGINELNLGKLNLDQTTPQSIINGKPTVQGFQFNSNPTVGAFSEGKLYYDNTYKTLSVNIDNDVNLQIGQETLIRAINNTSGNMLNGQVVYLSGASGVFPTIALAKGDSLTTAYVVGVLTQNINIGEEGFVTVRGVVHDYNTDSWNTGDDLFLSDTTAGALTNISPTAPSIIARVGRVIVKNATVGSIYVNPRQINQLSAMSDTNIVTPTVDQILRYNGAAWVNGASATSSASNGINFYFNDTTIIPISTNNINEVCTLSKIPDMASEIVDAWNCTNNTVLGEAYLYNIALGRTNIDAGVWEFAKYASVSSTTGGRISTLSTSIRRVRPASGTVTITGTLTSRTATASTGTPFATSEIDTGETIITDSYLQTPLGLYRITARTSNTVVTIETPSGYSNESTVAFSVWKQLFSSISPTITSTTTNYALYTTFNTQPAYTVVATDKIGVIMYATSNNTTTVNFVHSGSTRNSYIVSPLITLHGNLAGLQGGTGSVPTEEYYHLTAAQYTVAGNTSGTNTGDNTFGNGVTQTVKAVSNDLITGKSGGQTIIGDTVASGVLNIRGNSTNLTTGQVNFLGTKAATSTTDASVIFAGGVGISGETYHKNNIIIDDSYAVKTTTIQMKAGLPLVIKDPAGVSKADFSYLDGSLSVYGTGTGPTFPNMRINTWDTQNSYIQNNIQNLSNGASASSDWIATADNGSDTSRFIDMGINSSGFSGVPWTINGPNDGYLYTNSGVLSIGTATTGKDLTFFTGGTLAANERARITSAGKFSIGTAAPTGKFEVFKAESSELIINVVDRNFSGANNWTGTNWAIVGGAFVHTSGSTANAVLANVNLTSVSIKAGRRYKVYYTVAGNTVGTITPKIGTASGAAVSVTMGAGNYMSAITCLADNADLIFTPTSTFDGSITNISVIEQGLKFQINEAGDLLVGTTAFSSGNMDFIKEGNAQVLEMSDYYDSNTSNVIRSVKYRGTIASPKAILDSDTLFNFQMGGYDGTSRFANQAGFGAFSSGNWTPSNHGAFIRFTATPINTITSGTVAEFYGDKIFLGKFVGIGAGMTSPASQIDAATTLSNSTIASKGYALISTFGATTGAVTVAEDGVNFVSYASTNVATAEVIRIVATVVPTSAGNITFSIRGVSSVVAVSNLTETTVNLLATAINTALNLDATITTNWTVTVASATVTLTAKVAEAKTGTNSFTDTGSTGCVTTVTVTTTGLSVYNHTDIRAMTGSAYNNGAGLVTNLSGLVFTGGILGTGNVTNFIGADLGIFGTGAGKFGTISGLTIRSMNGYHSDASTVSYGINLSANTTATGSSKYGIYIGGISGASTNNYSIYSVSGINYFGGNVGIGITSPVQKLAINDVNTITNSFGNAFIGTTNSQGIDLGGQLTLGGVYTSTTQVPFAGIAGRKYDAIDTSTKGYLSLSTLTSGTLTEKMRIDNLGNIGIGTSTPLTFGSSIGLHLSGMTEGTYPTITLQRNDTIVASTNVYGTIQWYSNDSDHVTGNICSSIESVANGTQSGVYPKADIKISTADGTTDISEKFRFYSDGRIAQGTSASTAVGATFAKAMTGATTQYAVYQGGTIKSDVTSNAYSFISAPVTEAASFALNLMYHYSLLNPTIGSGSSITNQIGYYVPSAMTGATNNYGFYGSLASATNRWNIYMVGTADNYLAGKLGIGTTIPAMALDIEGTASTTGVQATRYTAASAGSSPYMNFRRSRGTSASPVVVNQGDNLGLFYFYGWKDEKPDPSGRAAEWVPGCGFGALVENDSATEHLVKGAIYFKTNTVGDFTSDGSERMRISNAGYLGVNVTAPTALVHIGASSTVRASLCMNAGTAPTSPVSGDIWNDSTQACIRSQSAGITKSLSGVIFTQTASATVGNTTTETSVIGTGVGVSLLPANFWVAGKTIRLKMYGHISCTAADTASVRIKVGSVTVASSIDDAFPVTLTNSLFIAELIMTCRTTGATGTIFVQGSTTIYAASSADMTVYGRQIVTTSAVTIDTTATGQLNATYQWSAARAGNTITSTNSVIEVLN